MLLRIDGISNGKYISDIKVIQVDRSIVGETNNSPYSYAQGIWVLNKNTDNHLYYIDTDAVDYSFLLSLLELYKGSGTEIMACVKEFLRNEKLKEILDI